MFVETKQIIKLYEESTKRIEVPKKKYQVLSFSSTREEIKQAVIEEFGHKMAKIVECESGFKPTALNTQNKNGTHDKGLFQINAVHIQNAKQMGINLDTIQGQFKYARYLVDRNGYKDWVCSRTLGVI